MKNKKTLILGIISITILIILFGVYFIYGLPNKYYKVYIDSDYIGLIEEKEDLEEYIYNQKENLKEKYKVESIYPLDNIKNKTARTYREDLISAKEIINKIEEIEFTVEVYSVTISSEENIEPKTYKVSNIDFFNEGVEEIIKVFTGKEEYENYKNKIEKDIEEYGEVIQDIYYLENIEIEKEEISIDENIYTSAEEISKSLLYGETELEMYTIKKGDTIEQIAYKNNLYIDEFLIANPKIKTDEDLVDGETVEVGLISPQISIVVEYLSISKEISKYETVIQYDNSKSSDYEKEIQTGKDGFNKVESIILKTNGKVTSINVTKSIEIESPIDRIYIKGM